MQSPVHVDRYGHNATSRRVNTLLLADDACETVIVGDKVVGYIIHPAGNKDLDEVARQSGRSALITARNSKGAFTDPVYEFGITVSNLLGAPTGNDGLDALVAVHDRGTMPEVPVIFISPEVFENPDNMAVMEANAALLRNARAGYGGSRQIATEQYMACSGTGSVGNAR